MATVRKVILATDEIYHLYNRGVEKRPIFTRTRDYERAKEMIWYYRYQKPRLRYSHYKELSSEAKSVYIPTLTSQPLKVAVLCYSLMPNHFHFLLRQEQDGGITKFFSAFCNSYAKYFNTKYKRVGPLFQGEFKAVRIEDNEQLLHVSRYIHLNPSTAFLVEPENLSSYPWTSLPEYVAKHGESTCDTTLILSQFSKAEKYASFVSDQAGYQRSLNGIHQALFEE
ncbi:MAG: transposase [Patescibacteria group bacterium]